MGGLFMIPKCDVLGGCDKPINNPLGKRAGTDQDDGVTDRDVDAAFDTDYYERQTEYINRVNAWYSGIFQRSPNYGLKVNTQVVDLPLGTAPTDLAIPEMPASARDQYVAEYMV